MTNEKESMIGKIMVFLDGKTLFTINDKISLWKSREKISVPRRPQMQTEIKDFHTDSQPTLKQIESKVVARIEMRNRNYEEILCLFCYELLEPTKNQIVQDIVKIKQELSR